MAAAERYLRPAATLEKALALRLSITLVALTALLTACGQQSSPPPAPQSETASAERADQSSHESSDATAEDDADDAQTSFLTGGAKVGDADTQKDVTKCLDAKTFYDRFSDDSGTCTELPLAKVDCTLKGVKAILSAKQRKQFDAAMAGNYKDWLLDQCVDCAEGAEDELCKNADGDAQVGTKLFFVHEEDAEIRGKVMLIPVRPGVKKTAE
jgi:hypothetical protein